MRILRDGCQSKFDLEEFYMLLMGISNDYDIAIEEGASMVRIGSDLFGISK